MNSMNNKQLFLQFVVSVLLQVSNCEFYTSTADLQKLVNVETVLVQSLEQYINEESKRLSSLKRFAEQYSTEQRMAVEDIDIYVSNPISSYMLIKRLTADWKEVESLMNTHSWQEYLQNISMIRHYIKNYVSKDLMGAAFALARLQEMYKLNVSDFVQGKIQNIQFSSKLSASDCFELAQEFCTSKQYNDCILWLKEADSMFKREEHSTSQTIELLTKHMLEEFQQGNFSDALDLSHQLQQMAPDDAVVLQSIKSIKRSLEDSESNTRSVKEENLELKTDSDSESDDEKMYMRYQQLCRGEILNPNTSDLKCSYNHFENAFLLIAPFKVEEIFNDPEIAIFHDILSDREIDDIILITQSRLSRSKVLLSDAYAEVYNRISKTAYFEDAELESTRLSAVTNRISDMIRLVTKSAEALQVTNYGIGGHNEPHFDYFTERNIGGPGNRYFTVLIYMSDVILGGATAFPYLNITVWPKKGSGLVWNNLYPSGEGNPKTVHGGCPVLVGSKWICTKWYHDEGNELLKPCKSKDVSNGGSA